MGARMRRIYMSAILLCVFLSVRATVAQQELGPKATRHPAESSTSQKPGATNYSQEPFVIEQYYTTARFENDGTSQRDLAARIRVQSDAGVQQLGELVFGYNSSNEQMEVRTVRVRKPDGTIVTAAPDSIKEMTARAAHDAPMYTDYKEKHITVPSLHAGDTIEYEIVTRTLTSLAPGEFWFAYNFLEDAIVLDERLEVDVPQGRAITIRSPEFSLTNGREDYQLRVKPGASPEPASHKIPFSKSDENGRTIYHWHHANLIRPPEDGKTKKKEPRAETKRPDVELTTFEGWQGVAQWYAKLEKAAQ